MTRETIGHVEAGYAKLPEVRSNLIEARFVPPLSTKDRRLASLNPGQLDFFASVLS